MRKRGWNPSPPSPGRREDGGRVASVVLPLVVSISLILCLSGGPSGVKGAALLFTQEPMIVSQEALTGACTDASGTEHGDLEEWTSTAGACDRIVCHVEPSGNYTVTHSCRPIEPNENPDTDNCQWVSDNTQAYPDCCPKLSCGQADALTTVDPLSCFDLASAIACGVWYNLTSACTQTTVDVFNISQVFCRSTCGLC